MQARLRILHKGAVKEVSVRLRSPRRLIPVHINNAPPSYYILGGGLLLQACMLECCGDE